MGTGMGTRMKDLCSRGRAAMALLLLLSIFQGWLQFTEISERLHWVSLLHDILPSIRKMPAELRTPEMETYLQAWQKAAGLDVKLSLVMAMEDSHHGSNDLERDLAIVKTVISQLKLDPDTHSIRDLAMANRTLEIPLIKQDVDIYEAPALVEIASAALLAYLFVLFDSMRALARDWQGPAPESLDLVPFYSSRYAFGMTTIWLLAPTVCAWSSAMQNFRIDTIQKVTLAVLTPLFAGLSIYSAWRVRKRFL
jgi:hypothetical protein